MVNLKVKIYLCTKEAHIVCLLTSDSRRAGALMNLNISKGWEKFFRDIQINMRVVR